ncbi:G-protein coupled receptor 54-like [Diadema antillarum]|uniref:G-protein coupled receptor 54-like n=1 Tax=Diadema antillarum TaxID=105358 RepID=UPI003A8A44C2
MSSGDTLGAAVKVSHLTDIPCPRSAGVQSNSTTDFAELYDLYLFLPIAVIGITCNLLVIGFVASFPSLRTTINQLKANLAVSDIIYLTINAMLNALMIRELSWIQCQVVSYLQYIAQQATCCLLLVMTLLRYDVTINPLTSIKRWTKGRRTVIIVCAWIASFVLMVPSVIFSECDDIVTIGHIVTYSYVTMVIFVIPMIIHSFCYARILMDFTRSNTERKRSEGSIRSLRWVRHREKKTLTRQVVVIVIVFFICRAPLEAFLLWSVVTKYNTGEDTDGRTAIIVHLTCKTLAYITGIVNPFIYAFCSPSFKSVFRGMMPKQWRRDSSTTHILSRWSHPSQRGSYVVDWSGRSRPSSPHLSLRFSRAPDTV